MAAWAVVACASATGARTFGQSPAQSRAIDAILAAVYRPDGPGPAVIVVKNGRTLCRQAYGLANVELGVPMRPVEVFP